MTENIRKPEEINEAELTEEQAEMVAGGYFVSGVFTCPKCGKQGTMNEIARHSKTCNA